MHKIIKCITCHTIFAVPRLLNFNNCINVNPISMYPIKPINKYNVFLFVTYSFSIISLIDSINVPINAITYNFIILLRYIITLYYLEQDNLDSHVMLNKDSDNQIF